MQFAKAEAVCVTHKGSYLHFSPLTKWKSCVMSIKEPAKGVPYDSKCAMTLFLPRGVLNEQYLTDILIQLVWGSMGIDNVQDNMHARMRTCLLP